MSQINNSGVASVMVSAALDSDFERCSHELAEVDETMTEASDTSIVKQISHELLKHQFHCVVAESCTGGKLSAALTDMAGSSQWFDRGFVTYSNESKQQLLGVSEHVLASFGAVSEETVCAMVTGALSVTDATVSIAVSGIAGPSGGTKTKPVGTVWIAWGLKNDSPLTRCYHFSGDRSSIRDAAVLAALEGLLQILLEYKIR